MRDRLLDVLDRVDAALAMAVGAVPSNALDPLARVARRARNRLDYPEDLAIVALAGGTGSGKSSLFNAILGQTRAEVGGVRPTTSQALISVPATKASTIDGYISSLGIAETDTHSDLPWLALIDLPDTDSVEPEHRVYVDELLPQVDAVVWVVDVEKYRDDALHHGYLRDLAPYESQFVFVLNQIDRVTSEEAKALLADFRTALSEDGYRDPKVLATAANPTLTIPKGIKELTSELESLHGELVLSRLLVDLEVGVSDLSRSLGNTHLEFEERWTAALDDSMSLVADNDVIGASRVLSSFFADLAQMPAGNASEKALDISAHIGELLRSLVAEAYLEVPPKRQMSRGWNPRKRVSVDTSAGERIALIRKKLDEDVSGRMLPVLRQRGVAMANLAGLAVELGEIRGQAVG